jgi:type VI secretion system secreted protein Hcp
MGDAWVNANGRPDMATTGIYLKLEGIDGESEESGYEKQIEMLSVSWGVSKPHSFHYGSGGSSAGNPTASDVSVMKMYDKASPTLFQYCTIGKTIPTATLTFTKPAGDNQTKLEYLVVTLTDVLVTSLQASGSGGDMHGLSESLSLGFKKMELAYKSQEDTGVEGASNQKSYDFTTGVAA